jgi:hypothetical protein
MCVIRFFNYKEFPKGLNLYGETVSLTPGLFLFLALLFCRDIRRVEKVGTGPRLQFRTFMLKNLPRMEKKLGMRPAAVAAASSKKKIPECKISLERQAERFAKLCKRTKK